MTPTNARGCMPAAAAAAAVGGVVLGESEGGEGGLKEGRASGVEQVLTMFR